MSEILVLGAGMVGVTTALALQERGHDVMIVDRMLPGLDGLSIVETIRGRGIATPVLILSALDQVDERVRGLKAGGDDYLAKPVHATDLYKVLERLAIPS
mgnify:CR=1 FL=1